MLVFQVVSERELFKLLSFDLVCLCVMDTTKEGGSTTRPPVLDGTNYSYWKPRMTAILNSIDVKTWKAVVAGWSPPMKT